jgi:hypothetical protein
MSPFVNASKGRLHDAVLENFNKACLKIRRHFRRNVGGQSVFNVLCKSNKPRGFR